MLRNFFVIRIQVSKFRVPPLRAPRHYRYMLTTRMQNILKFYDFPQIQSVHDNIIVHSYFSCPYQVDLAETDENGNENEKGNGRQEVSKCGIGLRPCKPALLSKIVWCIQRLVTGSRQAAHASYINIVMWANIR